MVIKSVELETVCGYTSKLPQNHLPEIAFAGRSNVGKSSLLNTLMNRKKLARISAQPGKTRTITYYILNDSFYLVDLPGYGYAKVPMEERKKWGAVIERYLHTSKALQAVFLLVDIRHDPTKDDQMMYDWIVQSGYAPIVVATKADKIKRSQLAKQQAAIRKTLSMGPEGTLIPFSALSKQGTEEVLAQIESFLPEE